MIYRRITRKQIFNISKHINSRRKKLQALSDLDLRLQAYLVPFETKIASILGPHRNQDCKLI